MLQLYIVRYLFKLDSLNTFNANCRSIDLNSTMELRRSLSNAYMLRNIKLWLFSGKYSLREDFEVSEDDTVYFECLDDDTKSEIALLRQRCKPISLEEMDYAVDVCINEVRDYAIKYVKTKLRFIYKSEHYDPEDFALELLAHCIVAIYNQYPRIDSTLHAINVCKRVIKNMGTNTIKRFTSNGRSTLYQNQDGTFSSYKCSYDVIINTLAETSVEYDGDLKYSIEALTKKDSRRASFVKCITGHDVAFTEWLKQNQFMRSGCNEEYFDRLHADGRTDEYFNTVANYLGATDKVVGSWLRTLKRDLGYI